MAKYLFTALMGIALIGVGVFTIAGAMALVTDTDIGIHPPIALVGVVFSAMVGGWASVAVDSDEVLV